MSTTMSISPTSIPTHTIPTEIIIPPLETKSIINKTAETKSIINKTAEFTSNRGPDFTKLIISKNKGNPTFNFLNTSNPYNPYYKHKLSQFLNKCPQSQVDQLELSESNTKIETVEEDHDDRYAVDLPEGVEIDYKQLEIIKVTAQFVASNGNTFLAQLKYKEVRNPLFGFLRETHSLNKCFSGYVEAYLKVLEGGDGLEDVLRGRIDDSSNLIERCLRRMELMMAE